MGVIGLLLFVGSIICLALQLACGGLMHRYCCPFGRLGQFWIALSVGATPVLWLLLNAIVTVFAAQRQAVPAADACSGGILLAPFLIVASFCVSWAISTSESCGSRTVVIVIVTAELICLWFAVSTLLHKLWPLALFPLLSFINYVIFLRVLRGNSTFEVRPAPAWFKAIWFSSLVMIIATKPFANSAINRTIVDMLSM